MTLLEYLHHKFCPMKIRNLHRMVQRILVRRNYGGKSLVSIKCHNLHSFKKRVILVYLPHLHGSALLKIPLKD